MMRNLISSTLFAFLLVSFELGDAKNVRQKGSRPVKANNLNVEKSSRVKGIKGIRPQSRGLKHEANEAQLGQRKEQEVPVGSALELEEDTGIIGGMQANFGEYPFYVKFEGRTLCGGALINANTVLTAAHCVDQGPPDSIRIGSTRYSNGGVVVGTKCSVSHENFIENDSTLMNDVAIIKLQTPVAEGNGVSYIPYNTDTSYPSTEGTALTVIGFGLTSNGGSVSNTLQKLTTEFVTIDECIKVYSNRVVAPENHICADVQNAGDCNGDSGGPVFVGGLQVGIVSFGYGGCASRQYQDVYVNVAAYSDWIESYAVGENCEPGEVQQDTDPDDSGGDGGGDGGVDTTDTGGDEVDEPSDFDQILECFTTVLELVQGLLGDDQGGNEGGNDNKGNNEEKDNDKDNNKGGDNKGGNDNKGGKQRGFLRNYFSGQDTEGGIVSNLLGRAQDVLTNHQGDGGR